MRASAMSYVNSDLVSGDLACNKCARDTPGKDLRRSDFLLIPMLNSPK
jgi:hypothetical protein